MQPGYPPQQPQQIDNNMTMSIVAIFLFWPLAIPAIINASKVNPLIQQGDYAGAQAAAASPRSGPSGPHRRPGLVGIIVVGLPLGGLAGTPTAAATDGNHEPRSTQTCSPVTPDRTRTASSPTRTRPLSRDPYAQPPQAPQPASSRSTASSRPRASRTASPPGSAVRPYGQDPYAPAAAAVRRRRRSTRPPATRRPAPGQGQNNTIGLVRMILGIASILLACCCPLLGVPAGIVRVVLG